MQPEYTVRFWGVRGSIACPGPDTVRYGGNTSCVEIRCGGRLMVFDGGTGLRLLGNELMRAGRPADWTCSTATRISTTSAACLFRAVLRRAQPDPHLGRSSERPRYRSVLNNMMIAPLFPIPMGIFAARLDFVDFAAGEKLAPHRGIRLATAPLNHPNGATGYRIEYAGKAVAYITDTEHRPDGLDVNILGLIEGADVMIYDATYTDAEYPSHKDWGHSTWEEGVRLANAAHVRTLVIFHHDPGHDDAFMDQVAADAADRGRGRSSPRRGWCCGRE